MEDYCLITSKGRKRIDDKRDRKPEVQTGLGRCPTGSDSSRIRVLFGAAEDWSHKVQATVRVAEVVVEVVGVDSISFHKLAGNAVPSQIDQLRRSVGLQRLRHHSW